MRRSYSELIEVSPRFARSVNLERDLHNAGAVDGYVLTNTAVKILNRVTSTFRSSGRHHAWTLTGPYGSGKSAFSLFAAMLLGPRGSAASRQAQELLRSGAPELHKDLFDQRRLGSISPKGYCPVVLTGAAEPIADTLLRSVVTDVSRAFPSFRCAALNKLQGLLANKGRKKSVPPGGLVVGIKELAESLQRSGKAQGLFIIIDELGKFLEFAARNPSTGDIFTLQLLAEATVGFESPALLLFTVLHQSFDRYVAGLRPSVREEFAKVQGRFDDVAFQESPEEFLLLISHAISQKKDALTIKLRAAVKPLAERIVEFELLGPGISKTQLLAVFQRCAPLHPLTVLALARLCRKFGQNQRSLFSFLVSREPKGFLSYLDQRIDGTDLPLYNVDDLYDYAADALGSGLSVGEAANRWAEIQTTLDKCVSAPNEELRVVKAIGLLSAIGSYGELKPSPKVLELALPSENVSRITNKLVKRSLVVYRRHSDSFGFWEGSDVELDVCLAHARRRVPLLTSVADRLRSLWTARPLVAKRHSIATGTLRYFTPLFVDSTKLIEAVEQQCASDGVLLYVIPDSENERERAITLVTTSPAIREREDFIIAVPSSMDAVREVLRELELLIWVQKNTPELQGDSVARRELRSRIAAAEEQLRFELDKLFSPDSSGNTDWFHRGIPVAVDSMQNFARLLSDVCDRVYSSTPEINNELINRAFLSSAAAAARRNLIEAMITRPSEPRLGLTGTPPEVSIYASVLEATGIHRQDKSGFRFGAPIRSTIASVWLFIEEFFESCELQKRPVTELFSALQKPPFGMKMGPIPILFCAAVLAYDTEVALYESGAFAPDLSVELFERLLRNPEKFEIRRYSIEGVRREVFNNFADLLESTGKAATPKETLIEVVRPLFRFFNRLPSYSRQTRTLSPAALAIRETLFSAKEPDALLFEELPIACGFAPFDSKDAHGDQVQTFFTVLRRGLLELQRAYDDLLGTSQQMLFRAFGISGAKGREIVRFRARTAFQNAVEPRLKAFLMHLMDEELEDVQWIEAIATLLASKPPKNWSDPDRAKFEVTLGELVRNFRHIESLVTEISRRGSEEGIGEVIRIGVTDRHSKDLEAVVIVEPQNNDVLADVVRRIEESLDRLGADENPNLALAALGVVSRRFLIELDSNARKVKSPVEESRHG